MAVGLAPTGFLRIAAFAAGSFVAALLVEILVLPVLMAESLSDLWRVPEAWLEAIEAFADLDGEAFLLLIMPAVVVVLQVLFLLPVFRPPQAGTRPKRLTVSIMTAGLVVASLVLGLCWAALELFDRVDAAIEGSAGTWALITLAVLLPAWIVWSRVLFARVKPHDPLALDRLLLPLLKGTAVSVALLTPIDAVVRRKSDCYCATGSFFAIVLGVAAMLWLVGPFALLALSRTRRRAARRRVCLACGQEWGPGRPRRCTECGTGRSRRMREKAGE